MEARSRQVRVDRHDRRRERAHAAGASKVYVAPRFHMFYGFVAFLSVGIAYQYRRQMRGRREMFYGLVGLFLMGLGIRAVLQAS